MRVYLQFVLVFIIIASSHHLNAQNFRKVFTQLNKNNTERAIVELQKANSSKGYTSTELILLQIATALVKNSKTTSNYDVNKSLEIFQNIDGLIQNLADVNKFLKKYKLSVATIERNIFSNILDEAKEKNTEIAFQNAINLCDPTQNEIIKHTPCYYLYEARKLKEKSAYNEAVTKNNIESFAYFVNNYKQSKYYEEIYNILIELEFKKVKSKNSVQEIKSFLIKYRRENKFESKAISIKDSLIFYRTPKGYNYYKNYIAANPDSKYINQAQEKLPYILFNEAISNNNIQLFEKFMKDYPEDRRVKLVEGKLEKIYFDNLFKIPTEIAFNKFKNRFPNNSNIPIVLKRLRSLSNTENGEYLELYLSGQTKKTGHYKDGKRDGDWKWYFESGNKWAEKTYNNSKEIGISTVYTEDGKIYEQIDHSTNVFRGINTKRYESDGDSCTNCYWGTYVSGSCDRCGGVSNERLKESISKRPKCSLCNGTGREKSRTSNESRTCPMCNGKGYRTIN